MWSRGFGEVGVQRCVNYSRSHWAPCDAADFKVDSLALTSKPLEDWREWIQSRDRVALEPADVAAYRRPGTPSRWAAGLVRQKAHPVGPGRKKVERSFHLFEPVLGYALTRQKGWISFRCCHEGECGVDFRRSDKMNGMGSSPLGALVSGNWSAVILVPQNLVAHRESVPWSGGSDQGSAGRHRLSTSKSLSRRPWGSARIRRRGSWGSHSLLELTRRSQWPLSAASPLPEGRQLREWGVLMLSRASSCIQSFKLFLPVSTIDRIHGIGGKKNEPIIPTVDEMAKGPQLVAVPLQRAQ